LKQTGWGSPAGFLLKTGDIYKSNLKKQEREQRGKKNYTKAFSHDSISMKNISCLLAGSPWQTRS
jgi:hypothetical protein